MAELSPIVDSEREFRWRAWQDMCRRSNQCTEKQMKIVF